MNQEDIKLVFDLMKDRNEKEIAWVKQVISFISIILGLIISLKADNIIDQKEYFVFAIAIILNTLCVLFGLGFLYSETSTLHLLILEYKKKIENPRLNNQHILLTVSPKKIYVVFKYCFVIFLFFGMMALVIFALFSAMPHKLL